MTVASDSCRLDDDSIDIIDFIWVDRIPSKAAVPTIDDKKPATASSLSIILAAPVAMVTRETSQLLSPSFAMYQLLRICVQLQKHDQAVGRPLN